MKYMVLVLVVFMLPARTSGGGNSCSTPEDISNGRKDYTGVSEGNTVTYTCRLGFVLSNDTATRTCQSNGTWDGTLPTCTDMDSIFTFMCFKNGTVIADNPDPSSLIWAQASNADVTCNTSFSAGYLTVEISDCDIDKQIQLVLSPFVDGIPRVISNNVKYYNVTCLSIPLDGIHVNVTDSSWVKNLVVTSREPLRTPKIIIDEQFSGVISELEIRNITDTPGIDATQRSVAVVEINELIRWRLYVPEPYIIQPLNCTAFSGAIDESGSLHYIKIIELGCTLDLTLITDFQYHNATVKHEVYANLFAFRFPDSNELEIVCSVKACPPHSTACDFSCDGRKRRSVPSIISHSEYSEMMAAAEESAHRRSARAADGSDQYTAKMALRVVGPPNVALQYLTRYAYLTSSSQRITQWTVPLICCVAVVSRFIRI